MRRKTENGHVTLDTDKAEAIAELNGRRLYRQTRTHCLNGEDPLRDHRHYFFCDGKGIDVTDRNGAISWMFENELENEFYKAFGFNRHMCDDYLEYQIGKALASNEACKGYRLVRYRFMNTIWIGKRIEGKATYVVRLDMRTDDKFAEQKEIISGYEAGTTARLTIEQEKALEANVLAVAEIMKPLTKFFRKFGKVRDEKFPYTLGLHIGAAYLSPEHEIDEFIQPVIC